MSDLLVQILVFSILSGILLAVLSHILEKKKIKNKAYWTWTFIIIYGVIAGFLRWLIFS